MTEQTPQDEATEEKKQEDRKRPEPRDAAYWAHYAETLTFSGRGADS